MDEQSERLAALAEAQRENNTALRAAIQEALDAGVKWREIGDALGMTHHETVFRQFKQGSPIVVVNAYQGGERRRAGGGAHPEQDGTRHVRPPSRR